MGACEDMGVLFENQDEIKLGTLISSNGTHHEDQQPTEEEVLAKQLESVVLQAIKEEEKQNEEARKSHIYPWRPYAVDCNFYLRTGSCKFGKSCRFNHPIERAFQYFQTPGGCRLRDACRYNHSMQKPENERLVLNFLGLPVRPSEQECNFYMRTGSCGYGTNCRFNHPGPFAAKKSNLRNSLAYIAYMRGGNNLSRIYPDEKLQSSGISRGIADLSNGITLMNGSPYDGLCYHQPMSTNPACNQDQVKLMARLPLQILSVKKLDSSTNNEQVMQSEEFPVRPGQPDCDLFMKTGDCKYRAACRYNHPVSRSSKLRLPPLLFKRPYSKSLNGQYPEQHRDRLSTSVQCALNETGLPLRPGSKICQSYELQGTCKYGKTCIFDHPKNCSIAVFDHDNGEDFSSTDPIVVDLEPCAVDNVEPDWGDGWEM
ncbi:zinc finger CCCH domain-containing protein 67-like isoform X2 [Amaranthus tricolor]|uniref:zinc finger CCCH domain-containing protein 67-like isoform X2 n=1 Tax=Amaranthus tricolor TaxID=29722 RepID=UPI002583FF0F|nr:zinc finger CCCH domain-containing protein 67-like isoform X2 [Amaranthus tricolor]